MKEKLQEYALIAEIISAVCIVLSLLFVGIQIGQSADETAINSRAIEASVREQLLISDLNILQLGATDPDLQFSRAPDKADTEQLHRAANFYYMLFRTRENYWKHFQSGLIDESTWSSYRQPFLFGAGTPFFLRVWNSASTAGFFEKNFADAINLFMTSSGIDLNNPAQLEYPMPGVDI